MVLMASELTPITTTILVVVVLQSAVAIGGTFGNENLRVNNNEYCYHHPHFVLVPLKEGQCMHRGRTN